MANGVYIYFLLSLSLSAAQEDCTYFFPTATCSSADPPLTTIPNDISSDVRRIILKDNAIDQLYPGNLTYYPDLDYLDLSNNLIEVFPANLESTAVPINDLILDYNPIVSIEERAFEQLNTLYTLSLKGTRLTTLNREMFAGLTSSSLTLDLQESKLEYLPSDAFEEINLLDILNLHSNDLQTIPEGILSATLAKVHLRGNPWSCDCRMKWFKNYLDSNLGKFEDKNLLLCQWPNPNTLMTSLSPSDFKCYEPSITIQPSDDSILSNISYTIPFEVDGAPFPNITWFKDGELVEYNDNVHLDLYDGSLHFTNTLVRHSGVYYVEATNDNGTVTSTEAILIVTEVTCFDGVLSDHETDVDCGGQFCDPCNYTQRCLKDSDCSEDLVCLYSYELASQLHYISPANPMAYTCDNASVAEDLLNSRVQSALATTDVFRSNFTANNNLEEVHNALRKILSEILSISESFITDVHMTTVERRSSQSDPLVQIWFNLIKNSHGRKGKDSLLQLVDSGQISGTIRVTEEKSYFFVRINL